MMTHSYCSGLVGSADMYFRVVEIPHPLPVMTIILRARGPYVVLDCRNNFFIFFVGRGDFFIFSWVVEIILFPQARTSK